MVVVDGNLLAMACGGGLLAKRDKMYEKYMIEEMLPRNEEEQVNLMQVNYFDGLL